MNERSNNILTYYRIFLRYQVNFIVPAVVVFCLVSLSSLFFQKVYQSTTVVRIQRSQPNPIRTERVVRDENVSEMIRSIRDMLLSRPNLIKTIKKLKLDQEIEGEDGLERMVVSLREKTEIVGKARELFAVSYRGSDPAKVMETANTMVELFIESNLTTKRDEAFSSVDFIQNQLEVYKQKLEKSEEALQEFKQEHIGEMPGEQKVNLIQLERLRDALANTTMKLQEAIGRKRFLEQQLSSENQMIVTMRGGQASTTEEQVQILEFQLSQLLANYTEKHPDVIRVRSEIERLRMEADEPTGKQTEFTSPGAGDLTALNPLYQKIKEENNNIKITIGTLQTRKRIQLEKIAEYEKKVDSIPNQEKYLASLQRDYDVNEKIYNMLLMKHEEARISKHLEFTQGGTRFHIIEKAIVPTRPIKPNRLHFLVAGLALGCAAGVGFVYVKEYLNTSTRGVDEAEEVYKIPVLGTIPLIETEREIYQKKASMRKWILGSTLFLFSLVGAIFFALIRGF